MSKTNSANIDTLQEILEVMGNVHFHFSDKILHSHNFEMTIIFLRKLPLLSNEKEMHLRESLYYGRGL